MKNLLEIEVVPIRPYVGELFLVSGIPGAGKSTLCATLSEGRYPVRAADDLFTQTDGTYNFDRNRLHEAHQQCQTICESDMIRESKKIFINNTFTTSKEFKPYKDLAEKYNYKVFIVTVENHHGGKNIHNVPEETLIRMEANLKNRIKLR